MLTWLQRDSLNFPPLHRALREPNGLLAAGGDLSPERLIQAYRHGCFPWFQDGQPILWWSPDPRTVLFPEELHVSRSLEKCLRQQRYKVTFDQQFSQVIQACAAPRTYADGTWITRFAPQPNRHSASGQCAHGRTQLFAGPAKRRQVPASS